MQSKFELKAVTRFHEVGIVSNRESARHGELVPRSCTHRPSMSESLDHLKWFILSLDLFNLSLIIFL